MGARGPSMDPFGASVGLPWAPLSPQSTTLGPILVVLDPPECLSGPPTDAFEPSIAVNWSSLDLHWHPGRLNPSLLALHGSPWASDGRPDRL